MILVSVVKHMNEKQNFFVFSVNKTQKKMNKNPIIFLL